MRESLVISQKVRTFAPVLKMVVIHSVRANGNRSLGKNAKVSLFYGQPDAHRCMPSAPVITAAIQKDFGALRGTAIFRTTGCAAVPLSNRLLGVDRVMKQEQEIWKDIEGYEGRYQVSNLGRVKSLGRVIDVGSFKWTKTETLLRPILHNNGYRYVAFSTNGRIKQEAVHRLVARAFVDGYRPGLIVNHIDEDKTNNIPSNLEWVTHKQNLNHGTRTARMSQSKFVAVEQYNLDGVLIATYESVQAAEKATGVDNRNICACCRGKRKSGGSYRWAYKTVEPKAEPRKRHAYPVQTILGEEWREIAGYEGHYMISNMGRVWSVANRQLRKQRADRNGRLSVGLWLNGRNRGFQVNRLVAMAFCDGYAPGKEVNHKDENVKNNCADNLEWVTQDYNLHYGTRAKRMSVHFCKPVLQFTLQGEFVREWESVVKAAKALGRKGGCISDCCRGRQKTAYGYKWKFKEQ